jgi:hypothetical protein
MPNGGLNPGEIRSRSLAHRLSLDQNRLESDIPAS